MASTRLIAALSASLLAIGVLTAAGCGDDDEPAAGSTPDTTATSGSTDTSGSPPPPAGDLSGRIVIDGSSTVAPLSSAAAEDFNGDNSGVNIEVRTSGTGGGFEAFCAGETDISDASRPIDEEEVQACAAAGIEYEEFRVASDGITLVTKTGATEAIGKTCLTAAELKMIWSSGSNVSNWSMVGGQDQPLALAGPGDQSGTYDFFNETILGEDAMGETLSPRQDYSASEDDNVTVRAVESAPASLGYFGFSYFEENQDRLEAFELDSGEGCVVPSAETITSGEYGLSRPLLIYVNTERLAQPHVREFVRYYLTEAVRLAEDTEFVPAPEDALEEALGRVPAA